MTSRRAFLASGAALAACGRAALEDGSEMAGLPLQLINVPLSGLNTKADPKGAPTGLLTQAENAFAIRKATGGVELRKRYGFTSMTKSIQGGGTLATGRQAAAYGDELVMTDGLVLYSYSPALAKWVPRGRCQGIAADIKTVSGNEGPGKRNVDVAMTNGYACYVASPNTNGDLSTIFRAYVVDVATGEIVGHTSYGASVLRCRVLALGTAFYIFSWQGTAAAKIQCQKVDTATPTTFGALTDVATDVDTLGVFDVAVDSTNARMVVAYRNSTPTLTLKIWTSGMAAGTSVAYSGIDPDGCVGFLVHDFADGNGYLAVGTSATPAARLLTFGASNMTVSANLLLESNNNIPRQITGYRAGSINNVFWTIPNGSTLGHNAQIRAYGDGTVYTAMASLGVGSRPFKIGTKWYLIACYQTDPIFSAVRQGGQQRHFLLELDESTHGEIGTVNIAGYLMGNDSAGGPLSISCLPSVVKPTATTALFGACGIAAVAADGYKVSQQHYTVKAISLDWSGAGLGRPVTYNGVLHVPAAAAKIYDGHFVVEDGFFVDPEAPYNIVQGTGGSLTLNSAVQYCAVWSRTDKSGRVSRSAPGPVTSVALTGSNNKVTLDIPCLRVTDADAHYNTNSDVTQIRIELYRTKNGLPVFYLAMVINQNSATSDTITVVDTMSDNDLGFNDVLYTTGGILDHVTPPAVKVMQSHQQRLFALTGDGAVWHTNESIDGRGTEFNDDLRFAVEDGAGNPVALASIDSSLVILKRNRSYIIQGQGPDNLGNNEYPAPQRLTAELGAVGATGNVLLPDGLLVQTAKGFYLLDRSLTWQEAEGADAYNGLTVTAGVGLDDLPMAFLTTGDRALIRDWELQQWYTATAASSGLAAVAAVRWQNQLCLLQADGTVKRQVAGQWNDDGVAIAEKVEFAWVNLTNARVYKALVTGEFLSTTTVTTTISRDWDAATASAKSNSVTTATKPPLVHAPNSGDCASLQMLLQESSTTEGVRVSRIDLEVGLRPGAAKHKAGAYAT